jgi:hypothetical protein
MHSLLCVSVGENYIATNYDDSVLSILIPPRHLIPPLLYPELRVCPILKFVIPTGLMRLMTVRYLYKEPGVFFF